MSKPLSIANLNKTAWDLQAAKQHNPRNEDLCAELYSKIETACAETTESVAVTFRCSLGSWVDDIADMQLQHCIEAFPSKSGANFKAYYRIGLINKAISELRKREKRPRETSLSEGMDPLEHAKRVDDENQPAGEQEVADREAAIKNFASRKRNLINQIRWSSAELPVMLLDQRRRMAKSFSQQLQEDEKKRKANKETLLPNMLVSQWCEQTERWLDNEPDLTLTTNDATIQDCYKVVAVEWDSAETERYFRTKYLSETVQQLSELSKPAFRRRVSRYMQRVRDELDHCEMLLFHFGPKTGGDV